MTRRTVRWCFVCQLVLGCTTVMAQSDIPIPPTTVPTTTPTTTPGQTQTGGETMGGGFTIPSATTGSIIPSIRQQAGFVGVSRQRAVHPLSLMSLAPDTMITGGGAETLSFNSSGFGGLNRGSGGGGSGGGSSLGSSLGGSGGGSALGGSALGGGGGLGGGGQGGGAARAASAGGGAGAGNQFMSIFSGPGGTTTMFRGNSNQPFSFGGSNPFGMFGSNQATGPRRTARSTLTNQISTPSQLTVTAAPAAGTRSAAFRGRLSRLPALAPIADGVELNMVGDTAVLTGQVSSPAERDMVGQLLMLEPGVYAVDNRLTVGR
jgi:hypothetical protein